MTYVLLFILFIIGFAVIYLFHLDGKYEVRQSRVYDQDIQTVFNKIRDFHSWPEWSPWLLHEPDTRIEYSEKPDQEGGYYTWDGKLVGAGKLQHRTVDTPNSIHQRLEFTRPFKNTCDVGFEFSEVDGGTEVNWVMKAEMPFFMRFMVPKMKQMIGQDFQLGLAMLAGALDPDAEHPEIDFIGEIHLESKTCLCKAFSGHREEMKVAMEQGYPELKNYISSQNEKPVAEPCTVYHRVDIKTMYFDCDMAIPVSDNIRAGNYTLKQLGAGKYYQVKVKGSYQFLELAWYAAMAHVYMLKQKMDKSRPSIEVYVTDDETVEHSNELETVLFIPIK